MFVREEHFMVDTPAILFLLEWSYVSQYVTFNIRLEFSLQKVSISRKHLIFLCDKKKVDDKLNIESFTPNTV